MKKLDNVLGQKIVLYTHYFHFKFSYLHTFYKPNNTETKPGILHFGPAWGIKDEERMVKLL